MKPQGASQASHQLLLLGLDALVKLLEVMHTPPLEAQLVPQTFDPSFQLGVLLGLHPQLPLQLLDVRCLRLQLSPQHLQSNVAPLCLSGVLRQEQLRLRERPLRGEAGLQHFGRCSEPLCILAGLPELAEGDGELAASGGVGAESFLSPAGGEVLLEGASVPAGLVFGRYLFLADFLELLLVALVFLLQLLVL
jgi:hypothetical protein